MNLRLALWSFVALLAVTAGCTSLPPSASPAPATAVGDNPTAGAIRRGTQQAAATLSSQATGTWQAAQTTLTALAADRATQFAAHVTSVASTQSAAATGQVVAAATAAWPQRIVEPFTDNQLGWPVGLTQDHYLAVTATVAGGHYQWLTRVVSGNSYFNLVPAKSQAPTDFYAWVKVQFMAGNDDGQSAYGLAFSHVKDDYGFFGILKSGGFRILEVHHTLIYTEYDSKSSAIDTSPGASNRLAVAGVGPDFVFLINDRVVGQLTAKFAPGQIGLGIDAQLKASPAEVDFSDFEIYAP